MRIAMIVSIAVILVAGSAIAVKKTVLDSPGRGGFYNPWAKTASLGPSDGGGCGGCAYGPGGAPDNAPYGGCTGGGCGRGGGAGANDISAARTLALDYYKGKYGDSAVDAEVKDYGCHMEAYIVKDGKAIMRLSLSGGNVYEI